MLRNFRQSLAQAVCVALLFCASVAPAAGLDLNRATRAQLEQLDGIGVLMAERLMQERAKAPFANWDDLQARVKGMRGKRTQKLQRQGVRIDRSAATTVPDRGQK